VQIFTDESAAERFRGFPADSIEISSAIAALGSGS
jgi:hypothetical protein